MSTNMSNTAPNNPSEPVLPLSSAAQIASYAISPTPPSPFHTQIETSQALHRINILNSPAWSPFLAPPSPLSASAHQPLRFLEIGPGQGTFTQVLAEALLRRHHPVSGELRGGHVDAVDPAPLDYGAPFTLGQAQAHLSTGPLGDIITWHQADPVKYLTSGAGKHGAWDVAVLAHSIWYFQSPSVLADILSALKGRAGVVCIAEYALHAYEKAAVPHVLASLARAAFEVHRSESVENIQTVLGPDAIKKIAEEAGWKVEGEDVVIPGEGLSDGEWEVGTVVRQGFVDDVEREVGDERVRGLLMAARDATRAAVEGVGGIGKVRTMDVWVASLVAE